MRKSTKPIKRSIRLKPSAKTAEKVRVSKIEEARKIRKAKAAIAYKRIEAVEHSATIDCKPSLVTDILASALIARNQIPYEPADYLSLFDAGVWRIETFPPVNSEGSTSFRVSCIYTDREARRAHGSMYYPTKSGSFTSYSLAQAAIVAYLRVCKRLGRYF
jgi:hypothetical protein